MQGGIHKSCRQRERGFLKKHMKVRVREGIFQNPHGFFREFGQKTTCLQEGLREGGQKCKKLVHMVDGWPIAIKKLCCIEMPVPSQVVCLKTISNEKRLQAVGKLLTFK